MHRARIVLAVAITLAGCSDATSPPQLPPATDLEATTSAQVLAEVNRDILARFSPDDRRSVTIGVLDQGLTTTSAIATVVRQGEPQEFYSYRRLGGKWVQTEELALGRRPAVLHGSRPFDEASDMWVSSIAQLDVYQSQPKDLYHNWEIQSGSYIAHDYETVSLPGQNSGAQSGAWLGSNQWVGDTLFGLKFSKWMYAANGFYCSWAQKTSTRPFQSFLNAAEAPNSGTSCGASEVHLWYSIFKRLSPLNASFTGDSPTSITAAGTYTWTINVSGGLNDGTGFDRSFAWEKSTDGGSSWSSVCAGHNIDCALYVGVGDPSFIVRVTVTSGSYSAAPARSVYVNVTSGGGGGTYIVISGPSELQHQEWGTWSATLSNGQYLSSCEWTVDGQSVQSGDCTFSDSWSDGTTQHTVSVSGTANGTSYSATDRTVTVFAPMECGPEGCMARRRKLPETTHGRPPVRKSGLISKLMGI